MPGGPFALVPAALPPHVFAAVRAALFVLALAPFAPAKGPAGPRKPRRQSRRG